jgi:peptide/nickel transport system permease protein
MVTIAFAVSAAILIESTLSFLGFGIGHESASWGSIIASARHYPQAWWLIIFPGLAIFFTVLSCNIIGERLTRRKSG